MTYQIVSIDTETTHWDKENEWFAVTQLAAISLDGSVSESQLMNPGEEILAHMPPDVIGVTGITPAHLKNADREASLLKRLVSLFQSNETLIPAAHNWPFDRDALDKELKKLSINFKFADLRYIDTYRLIRELYDDGGWDGYNGNRLPNYKLATCFYGIVPEDRWSLLPEGLASHDAQYDATMVMLLIDRLLEIGLSIEQMVDISATPFIPRVCPMGSDRGKPWSEVSKGLLEWMIREKVWKSDEGLELAILQEADNRRMI
jgi:DNA polymerase III epsilon subunit-like protein